MAGSYNHCIDDDGRLLSNEALAGMLENGGDVYEAVEEMYGMIWLLASKWASSGDLEVYLETSLGAKDRAVEISPASVVQWAQENYRDGLKMSPGTDPYRRR